MDVGLEPGKEIQDLRSASSPDAEMSNRLGAGSLRFKGAPKTDGVGESAWRPEEKACRFGGLEVKPKEKEELLEPYPPHPHWGNPLERLL